MTMMKLQVYDLGTGNQIFSIHKRTYTKTSLYSSLSQLNWLIMSDKVFVVFHIVSFICSQGQLSCFLEES